jgi:hypothetical protein
MWLADILQAIGLNQIYNSHKSSPHIAGKGIQFSLNIAVKYADTPTHVFFNIAILLYSSREPWVDLENPFPTPPNFAYLGIMLMPRLVSDLTPNRRFLENEGFSGVQGLNFLHFQPRESHLNVF